MPNKKKLYESVKNNTKNVDFDDFVSVVQFFKFNLRRTRGSHKIYKHPDVPEVLALQSRKNGTAKHYQVEEFLSYVEKYDLKMED